MPLNITNGELSARLPSWRDDHARRILLSLVIGGGIVFLPLVSIGFIQGPDAPSRRFIFDIFIGLAFWPVSPLSLIFPEKSGEPPGMAGGPPGLWLLLAPIISLAVYAVVAYILLSYLARRGRLK
jgi:hypothetical protein